MPNSSSTYKTGERILQSGQYECLNCKLQNTATILTMAEGKLFPYCTVCNVKDNTYKLLPKKK